MTHVSENPTHRWARDQLAGGLPVANLFQRAEQARIPLGELMTTLREIGAKRVPAGWTLPNWKAPAASTPIAAPRAASTPAVSTAHPEAKRLHAILTSPEAAGRNAQAEHLAFNTTESATSAIAILRASARSANPQPIDLTDAFRRNVRPAQPATAGESAEEVAARIAGYANGSKPRSRAARPTNEPAAAGDASATAAATRIAAHANNERPLTAAEISARRAGGRG